MTLLKQLNTLESAGLVGIAQLDPDLEYLFRHALVREAAYSSILSADQKELHLAVGEAIEILYPDKINEFAAVLSYHFGEAGNEQKALKYCALAGKSALASFANQEAESHFRCALGLASKKSEHADLLNLLGEALYRQSRYEETIQTWQEGISLYKQQEDYPGVARLYARSARAAWYHGDHPEGLRLSLEGLEAVKEMEENPSKAMLVHEAGRAYHFNGYPEQAEPTCRKALEMAERVGAVDVQADTLTTLGVLPNVPGDESLAYLTDAVELAESNGLMEIATRANHNLGVMTGEYLGDQKAAREHYLRAAELAKQRGAAKGEIFSLTSVAGLSLGMGDMNTAQEIVARMDQIRSTLTDPSQAQFEYAGIEFGLKFLSGEFEEALEIVRGVRTEARERGDLQMLHNYCTNHVDIYLTLDHIDRIEDWSEAEQAAKEGVEIIRKGVSNSIQAHSQLATIYIRQGKLDEARQICSEMQKIAADSPTFWQEISLLSVERDLARADRNWQVALEAAEAASKQLAQTGMRWYWAFSLIEWAETHLARGEAMDFERARTLYREALAVFEEMGSHFFVKILEGRLFALREKTIAMTRETSGDFYDFIHLPGNKIGIVVADVADKGIGAALYMTTCRTLIRTYAGEHPEAPELVLANANRRILADTHGGLFITVFYAVLDAASGEINYCNAGHNPPFVFSPEQSDTHLELTRTGMPLGILTEADWEQGKVTLNTGDLLVGYTDGITENQNGEGRFFGEDRLANLIRSNLSLSATALQDILIEDVQDYSGTTQLFDDMTLLVVKRL